MNCFKHPTEAAVGSCSGCGGGGCSACLTPYDGRKLCAPCASQAYEDRRAAALTDSATARHRVIVATSMFIFFFAGSLAFWGSWRVAVFSGYSWAATYLGVIPFVRFVANRLTGGVISSSVTGALFGSLVFWLTTGWWLVLLGTIYAQLGGGAIHLVINLLRWRRGLAQAESITPPRFPDPVQIPL